MKSTIFVILLSGIALINACKKQPVYEVQYSGALRNAMRKADISAKINLIALEDKKHLYALGALENLKGEILIYDSKPYVTSVRDSAVSMDHSYDRKATLLVYTQVKQWQEITIPETIKTYAGFENFVSETAQEKSLNTDQPFPFMIAGNSAFIEWHIIDWKEGDTEHTHEKHKSSGLRGQIDNEDVEILGFYSSQHHGIFTHHSTNMHLHVKTKSGNLAGHVDDISFNGKMKLYLPQI